MHRVLGILLVLTFSALMAGCTTVRPWERGILAQQAMDPNNRPEVMREDFLGHVFDVREGSTGGRGAAGGGCGCN